MSKIKAACSVLLCALLLVSCSPAETQPPQELPVPSTVNYQTTAVKRGTFRLQLRSGGSFVYPITHSLVCEYDHAILKEGLAVHRGAAVKKGDVLATFTFDVSRAELEKLELAYHEAVSAAEEGDSRYRERIERYTAKISETSEGKIAALQQEQAKNDRKLFKLDSDRQIEAAKEKWEDYRALFSEQTLVAPCDGIVSSAATVRDGDEVAKNTVLFTIYSQDPVYFKVSSPRKEMMQLAALKMPVTVTSGKWTSSGSIAATPAGIDAVTDNSDIYIRINVPSGIPESGSPAAECTVLELKNMLLLDRRAVRSDASVDYVLISENGDPVKRNVLCGPENNEVVCILDGLSEGQKIILN